MCSTKTPKAPKVAPPPKPPEPVAPIVSAGEADGDEANRKKGIKSLKVETGGSQSGSGLNIP